MKLALQTAQGTVVVILPSTVHGTESQMGKGCVQLVIFIYFFKGRAFTNDSKLFVIFIPLNIPVGFTIMSTDTILFARGNKNKHMKSTSLAH